jgi:hypothetical protein
MTMTLVTNLEDEIIEYRDLAEAGKLTEQINSYIEFSKREKEESFAVQEVNCLNVVKKICGEQQCVINLIEYYLTLPMEERREIVSSLGWGKITDTTVIQDFAKSIQDVKKK